MSYYVHQISPFAIQFTETFGVRWYGLAYLAAFVLGYFFVDWLAKKNKIPLTREQASDLVTYGAIGVLGGGRLGYALFYSPELFLQWSSSFPFWGVLEIHKGGMSSHGGILGVVFMAWLFGKKNDISMLHILDLTTIAAGLGFFFGRIANFVNGELYGREAPQGLSWAVQFPQEIYNWGGAQLQKLQSLGPAVEALGPIQLQSSQPSKVIDVDQWSQWVQRYDGVSQNYIDHVKDLLIQATQNHQSAVIEALGLVLTPRYPSQLIQAFLEGFLVLVILLFIWRRPQKYGVLAGTFGVSYCVARIIGEQYRLPDYGIGFQWLGLTRGQWLSIGMVFVAIAMLVYALRRDSPRAGGWNTD